MADNNSTAPTPGDPGYADYVKRNFTYDKKTGKNVRRKKKAKPTVPADVNSTINSGLAGTGVSLDDAMDSLKKRNKRFGNGLGSMLFGN